MNINVKCPSCGLVNWSDALTCKRCALPLDGDSRPASETTTDFADNFNPVHQNLDDMSYPSYSSYVQPVYGRAAAQLAGRGARLGASFVDGLCMLPVVLVALFAGVMSSSSSSGGRGADPSIQSVLGLGAIAFILLFVLLYFVVQLYLLTTKGQSIGKKAMGICIVKQSTYENGGFFTNVVMRMLLPSLIGSVPIIGPFFSLTDILFIFRDDRRCIHDHIAGTIVVGVDQSSLNLR